MGEATLVSWNRPTEHGEIAGSEWMCPVGSLDTVSNIEWAGGIVTDTHIRTLAHGRLQRLELITFPEGYHAARVVDAETGTVLTGEGRTYRYGGLIGCTCDLYGDTSDSERCSIRPSVDNALEDRPIPLGDNRALAWVFNSSEGTQTIVVPAEAKKPDAQPDHHTTMVITPQARKLFIATATKGKVGELACDMRLDICEENAKVQAKLALSTSDGRSTLQIGLNGQNCQHEQLAFRGPGILRMLGVNAGLAPDDPPMRTAVTDPVQHTQILNATAEALGWDKWQGLDLRLTAAKLYADMGLHHLDPSTVLTPLA